MSVSVSGSNSCAEKLPTAEKHDNSTAEKIIKQSSSVRTFGLLVDLGPLLAGLAHHWGIDQGGQFLQG
jgi:hypothetical protein